MAGHALRGNFESVDYKEDERSNHVIRSFITSSVRLFGNKNDGQKPSGDQNQNSSADKKPAGVPQVTVVKTGDSGAPIGIFVVLAIVAAGAVVVVVLRMKADQKKNAKKKHRNRPDGTR